MDTGETRGGLNRTANSAVTDASRVRNPNSVVRAAVTTTLAGPAWRSGRARLPIGLPIRTRFGVSCASVAAPGVPSEKSGVFRPFCSRTISTREKAAFGDSTETSRAVSMPIIFDGPRILIVGAAPRPAMTNASPAQTTRISRTARRYRIRPS